MGVIYGDNERHKLKIGCVVVEWEDQVEGLTYFCQFRKSDKAKKFAAEKKKEGYKVHAYFFRSEHVTTQIGV